MSRLLYVEASPMKTSSHSIDIAQTFLEIYRVAHEKDEIDVIDLWNIELPPFDADMIGAKFAVLRAQNASDAQLKRWSEAVAISRRFNSADKYLFSVPMWNFGVPYRLKHFIDVVTLPGENWSWSRAEGYKSLLSGKKAALIYTSAGAYELPSTQDAGDFQKPYLRKWLSFIGVDDQQEINAAPTLTDPDKLAETKAKAKDQAKAVAFSF